MAFRCTARVAPLLILLAGCSLDTSALGTRTADAGPGADAGPSPDGAMDAFVPPDGGPVDAFVPPDTGPADAGTDGFVPPTDACTPTAETCNGLDDDCNGTVDDGLTPPACALTVGVCAGTTQTCGGSSGWLACDASTYGADYEADETTCDDLDNDCDGSTDEAFSTLGDSCTDGSGACMVTGTYVCNGAGDGVVCSATAGSGGSETCNGVDDDCNGTVDDGLTAPDCALTVGVCAGTTQTCGGTSGWLTCDASTYGADYEADETTCDGLDNDCDGATDEPFTTLGDSCTAGVGACMATGSYVCNGAGDGVACDATPGGGSTEVCNGIDDDCDGTVDDPWPTVGDSCTAGMGACMATGTVVCRTDGTGTRCDATPGSGTTETCNGIDDDCDGTVDDGLTAPDCALTVGVCAGTTQTCGGTSGWLACDASTYGADYEVDETTCDGLDNDCDGATDEPFPTVGDTCTVGVGACAATGSYLCNGAGDGVVCSASPGAGSTETCDGVDDDCNGMVDDGLTPPSCALTQGVCAGTTRTCGGTSGWLACTASTYGADYEATETTCDGLDNDCDGAIDEGGICSCPVVEYGGHAYQFCTGADSWTNARDACRGDTGYDLVSVESDAEEGFVWGEAVSRDDNDWWLGLNDRGTEGTFVWSNGSTGTYRHWATGQPNNFGGSQNCASIDNGGGAGETRGLWGDRSCGDSRPYVCEAPTP